MITILIVHKIAVKQYHKRSELFVTYIHEGRSEDAKATLKSIDFSFDEKAKYDKALQLIELYVANKDVTNAIDIYENFTSEHHDFFYRNGTNDDYELKATKLIRGILIEVGDYDKGWQYYPRDSDEGACYRYEYMLEIVIYLCKNNRKSETQQFIKNYIAWFIQNVDPYKNSGSYEEYNSKTVKAKLLKVVAEY